MTAPVCVRQRIRQLDRQGLSHREISRKLGVSRTTVVKYANHGDYSPKPLGSGHAGRSLVDAGYSAVGKRAGRFRPGQGRGRRSRTRGAFPGGVVPVFEHALGGRPSRRDLGVRVPGFAVDLRAHGHGA